MPNTIKVLIKGLDKVIDFPASTKMAEIEKHIQGNWASVEEISGLPMDSASRMERAKYLGFKPIYGTDKFLYKHSSIDDLTKEAKENGFNNIDDYLSSTLAEKSNAGGQEFFGIRAMTRPEDFGRKGRISYKEGARINNSYNTLEDEIPEKLRGTSTVGLDYDYLGEEITDAENAIRLSEQYGKSTPRVIVGGTNATGGNDIGESIIENPVISGYIDKIRSVNAAFDPSKKESANLLAGVGAAAVGVSALSPEQAQAQQQAQKSFIKSMLSDGDSNFPSVVTADSINIDQMKLPQQYRADVGGFESPNVNLPTQYYDTAKTLGNVELPLIGKPLEGVSNYMQNLGYKDSKEERLKRAAMAGLDLI